MAVVVNADDFGISGRVNAAIAEAFEKKLIDRTTLLANMPHAIEAMLLAEERGFLGCVGVHINLTAGRPLTSQMAEDPVMCNAAGEFTGEFARNMRTRFFLPKATRENIDREMRAQIERYKDLGGTLWHVDSHHHVHTDPSIWSVMKKVIKDYPVTSVRLGRNMYRGGNPLYHIYKMMLNASIRRYCAGKPKYFGSVPDLYDYTYDAVSFCEKHEVEVMVHPVYDNAGKLADTSGGVYRELADLHNN